MKRIERGDRKRKCLRAISHKLTPDPLKFKASLLSLLSPATKEDPATKRDFTKAYLLMIGGLFCVMKYLDKKNGLSEE
jgi:hypothetical protein